MTRPITVMIAALGGQGGNVLIKWLINIAENCGYYAQSTSVPGVAQRTGATIYYCELFERAKMAPGKKPVMALMPVAGSVDLVIGAELLEAARAVQRGFVTKDRTTLIGSTHRDYAISEKMAPGNGAVNEKEIFEKLEAAAKRSHLHDMNAIAERDGVFISAVLLGAVAGSGALPFPMSAYKDAIGGKGRVAENNLKGLDAGYKATASAPVESASTAVENGSDIGGDGSDAAPLPLALAERLKSLPAPAQSMARYGAGLLIDYQDAAYGALYLDRLERIAAIDGANEREPREFQLSAAVAKHLAAWMSFEDTFRVADLKTRRSHLKDIGTEVRLRSGQMAYPHEFMKPRVQEICESLPAPVGRYVSKSKLAGRLLRPLTSGKKFNTGKIGPFLLLYMLGGMRRWRRTTLRFQMENQKIETWLQQIEQTAPKNYLLAVEIAKLQQLIKGYGETHSRGERKFNKALAAVAPLASDETAWRTAQILRNAALEQEDDRPLDEACNNIAGAKALQLAR